MTAEGIIKTEICDWLESMGVLFTLHVRFRQKFKPKYMRNGMPDIFGVMPPHLNPSIPAGTALFLEVKAPGGTISQDQYEILERARKMGAVAFVAYSLADMKKKLGERRGN